MARRVFFSFKYKDDVTRAMVVRKSPTMQSDDVVGFIDAADFEKIKKQGDQAIRNWIDSQLKGTSVTVVLVGANTCASRWVKYEIEQSVKKGNGILGINISGIKDFQRNTTTCCGAIPVGYDFYKWIADDGYDNLGKWIEKAAKAAGN